MDEQTFRNQDTRQPRRVINTSRSIHQRPADPVAQHQRAGMPEPEQPFNPGPDEVEEDEADRDGNTDEQTNVPPLEARSDEQRIPSSDDDSLFGDADISEFELKYPDPRSDRYIVTLVGHDVNGEPIRRSSTGVGRMPLGDLVRMIIWECKPT